MARKESARKSAKAKKALDDFQLTEEQLCAIATVVEEIAAHKIIDAANELTNQRMMAMIAKAESEKRDSRMALRFTTNELRRLFGDWYTLSYAFSVPMTDEQGHEYETDYWICSQDVSYIRVNDRPPLNKPISKLFGKDVYGFALIAPSTAF